MIGPADQAMKKALFLRTYTSDVTMLVTDAPVELDAETTDVVGRAGIAVEKCVPDTIHSSGHQAGIELAGGGMSTFDTIYPTMGCTILSKLAADLGAECDQIGNLVVDSRQRTVIPGFMPPVTLSTRSTRSRSHSGMQLSRQPTCTIIYPTPTEIG